MEDIYKEAVEKFNNNHLDDSKILLEKIIATDPNNHQSINLLGLIENSKNEIELSLTYINKAVELSPQNGYYRNNLGVVYLKKNDYSKALEEFKKAITYKKDMSQAYSNAGFVLHKKGEFDESKKMFETAISYNPNNAQAYINGANLCKDMGNYNEALGHYREVIDMQIGNTEAYLKSADIYLELKIYDEALKNYFSAIDIDNSLLQNSFLISAINKIYTNLFPSERFSFYNNKNIESNYNNWIEKIVKEDKSLLEFTDTEGIISLKCASLGLKNINLVSQEPFLASSIKNLIEQNDIKSDINIINKHPSELRLDEDIKEKVDYIIADIFQNKFPSYKEQLLIKSMKEKFLKEDGNIFPHNVKLLAAPIYSQELWDEYNASKFLDIDLSYFNNYRSYYLYEKLNCYDYDLLSKDIEVYNFDFKQTPEELWQKSFNIDIDISKECHGLVMWFCLDLDDEVKIDENPILNNKKQNYFIHLFDEIKHLNKGKQLSIDIDYLDFPIVKKAFEK